MKKNFLIQLVILFSSIYSFSYSQSPKNEWAKLSMLKGEWMGEGSGQPGQGEGEFTFEFSLDGKIMVGKNHSSYPALANRPAIVHDDLMIIYSSNSAGPLRSIYFDNEGHVIHYTVHSADDNNTIQFTSEVQSSHPGFRLTYQFSDRDHLHIHFEISPEGNADHFKSYLQGSAVRKK